MIPRPTEQKIIKKESLKTLKRFTTRFFKPPTPSPLSSELNVVEKDSKILVRCRENRVRAHPLEHGGNYPPPPTSSPPYSGSNPPIFKKQQIHRGIQVKIRQSENDQEFFRMQGFLGEQFFVLLKLKRQGLFCRWEGLV